MSREGADARLGRLLAIVPWIAAHDGPEIAEVCRRFGVRQRDLLSDLELLFLCGVYPFTPDVLIDVNIADGRVWISMADYFRRPLRLNRQEALALVAAGRAFLDVPGGDPEGALATALEKLGAALGLDVGDGLEVELGPVQPGLLDGLRGAAEAGEKVRIDYYSFGRDGRSWRVVQPWRVFNDAGHWYLDAWCEEAKGERKFRLDRIAALEGTGQTFDPVERPVAVAKVGAYRPADGDPVWTLDLAPAVHWIAEQYPNDGVEERDGGLLRVTLRSGQPAWLERLLLRAGPDLQVVEGDATLGPSAAARLLGRYRRG